MRNFAPASCPLGLHWHHFDQAILPPTIPGDIPAPRPGEDRLYLVYMAFENREQVCALLEPFKQYRFLYYDRTLDTPQQRGHIQLIPAQRRTFVEDLARCQGVICNAGFSLLSEAIHLGKKVLARPLRGQVEQESNALALEQLGLGRVMHTLDPKAVARWLPEPAGDSRRFPDVMAGIARWFDTGAWHCTDSLLEEVWRNVQGNETAREPSPAASRSMSNGAQ
jgi:uncharacterized protein (TIGR00661 family)